MGVLFLVLVGMDDEDGDPGVLRLTWSEIDPTNARATPPRAPVVTTWGVALSARSLRSCAPEDATVDGGSPFVGRADGTSADGTRPCPKLPDRLAVDAFHLVLTLAATSSSARLVSRRREITGGHRVEYR